MRLVFLDFETFCLGLREIKGKDAILEKYFFLLSLTSVKHVLNHELPAKVPYIVLQVNKEDTAMKVKTHLRSSRHRRRQKRSFQGLAIKALFALVFAAWIVVILLFLKGPDGTKRTELPIAPSGTKYQSPLLIITYKRQEYLERTLENVLSTIPQPCGFGCPVIVSEDGQHGEIEEVVQSFKEKFETQGIPLVHIHHKRNVRSNNAYKALAKHFGWAIAQVFDGKFLVTQEDSLPQRVMILEEDIQVAPDFFSYMEATSSLLDRDPTLYAVSAFNDNGHLPNGDPKRVLRSDFFPGLGWMMNRDLWKNELESKWPGGWWDDWLREPAQRKDRQVLRPEKSRTYHFGSEGGTSGNQFGSLLERNKLNEELIQWDTEDLSYLESSSYEKEYTQKVMGSKLVSSIVKARDAPSDSNVRMEYESFSHFSKLARQLEIMDDEKAMVPRTAYRGTVEVRLGPEKLLYLTPKGGFGGYKKEG